MNTYQRTARGVIAALSQSKLAAAKLALVLFVSVCQPFMAAAEQPAELSPDVPAHAVPAPHAVRNQSLVIEEGTEPLEFKVATWPGDLQAVVYGDTLLDAESGCHLPFLRLHLNSLRGNTLCERLCTDNTDYRMFFTSRR